MAEMRFADAIFCDDIRAEIGNKFSLMGVYERDILLTAVPIIVPRFCFVVTVHSPKEQPIKSLSLKLNFPGDADVILPVDVDTLRAQAAGLAKDEDALRENIIFRFLATPFQFKEEGTIRLTAIVDGEELYAGRLKVAISKEAAGRLGVNL